MTDGDWLDGLPVIGELPPEVAAMKLREVGEDELAQALAEAPEAPPEAFGVRSWLGLAGIGPGSTPPIRLGISRLRRARRLGCWRSACGQHRPGRGAEGCPGEADPGWVAVADYPGRGMHRVLFDFAARNQDQGGEQLHFSTAYRVREGEEAAVLGRPIFTGLQAGAEGLFLQCLTVNVLNEEDEALLRFLEGDAFTNGLQLLTTAQPALGPFRGPHPRTDPDDRQAEPQRAGAEGRLGPGFQPDPIAPQAG